MPTFEPPTTLVVPPIAEGERDDPLAVRLFSHYKARAQGYTVFKYSDGTVSPYPGVLNPTQYDEVGLTGASVSDASYKADLMADRMPFITSYLGGHVYTVSSSEAAALTAAGYTVT
jgi:hypothetical protein